MKKFLSVSTILVLLFSLCSCGKYINSYSAIGLVKNQSSHSCYASFLTLKGRLVFKIKAPNEKSEGDISYSVEAEEGEIRLYYDAFGTKEELASVKAGESVTSKGGYVEGGKPVYIIIEANEKSHGKVSVELDN